MRWEYRVLHDLNAVELNELGDEGWEMVTVEFDDEGDILNAFAKRPKDGGGSGGQGGGQGGGQRRRRRRKSGGGGQGGGGGGNQHPIGPMS